MKNWPSRDIACSKMFARSLLCVMNSGRTTLSGAFFCSNIVAAFPLFEGVRAGVFGWGFFGVTAPRHGRALLRGVFGTPSSSPEELEEVSTAEPDPESSSSSTKSFIKVKNEKKHYLANFVYIRTQESSRERCSLGPIWRKLTEHCMKIKS